MPDFWKIILALTHPLSLTETPILNRTVIKQCMNRECRTDTNLSG